jgi:hypothetical protein
MREAPPLPDRLKTALNDPAWRPARVRALTRGPKSHFFGYYDKLQFHPNGRYVLGMSVSFEGRSPRADDLAEVGMVDLEDGDRWIPLGETRAWCWQQACHLQWRPGSDREVLWNDRDGDRFVGIALDTATGRRRTLPAAVDNLSPDGRWALGVDFARVGVLRPGYGYAGTADPRRDAAAPESSGVYLLDLDSGERKMLVNCAQAAGWRWGVTKGLRHYLNHVQWSPDGRRLLFLSRTERMETCMFTVAADGSEPRPVAEDASHYVWRDAEHILIWIGKYLLYRDDGSRHGEAVLDMPNGHQTYLPDRDWLLADTYPLGPERRQVIYLAHLPSGRCLPLGAFPSPADFAGEWRCDTHPRLDPSAGRICFDSAHQGGGRQMYLLEFPSGLR